MKKRIPHLLILLGIMLASSTAYAQDENVTYVPRAQEGPSEAVLESASAAELQPADEKASADSDEDKNDDEDDSKGWGISLMAGFDIGNGAFTKHEYARKIRSRFVMELAGHYTIPVVEIDIHASTGFSQWMSKAGGSNGQYEFRWADSEIGLSRNIWEYDSKSFGVSFDADVSFALPTSKASWTMNLYTSIVPSLSASIRWEKLRVSYAIAYSHSFHKYTSATLDPSDVDVLSRSTGNELLGSDSIAIDGILTEMELVNQFSFGYRFFPNFGLTIGFGFYDGWSYSTESNKEADALTNPNAKSGRGHSQLSMGSVMLDYSPIKYLTLGLGMTSRQPWKTADNKSLRFPWYDSVSPSKNYTKFVFTITGQY